MKRQIINYETLLKVTKAMSLSRDHEKVIQITVESVRDTLGIKGSALFLINHKSNQLEVAASCGLSD